jgi:hypothetical protein
MNHQDNLFSIPRHIQTRWASAENWHGEKGAACKGENLDPILAAHQLRGMVGTPDLGDGRKRSPNFLLPPGSSKTLAEAQGTSGMIRRIWLTIGNRSPEWLRGIRLDIYWDGGHAGGERAPGRLLRAWPGAHVRLRQRALLQPPRGQLHLHRADAVPDRDEGCHNQRAI